ncbi:hypothetical protein [Mammaliicoccus sciuri]|uniref:hypothetical protein n=1 Tax=Mammaliicoccus sciuri TaxID=1296 RepID=UPI002B257432|nr:hypothetical protein [Mammaliicoccus sciuri]WQK75294.1 hypothetical protein P3U33_06050 [Mammaliicoccus sciuri]
MRLFSKRAKELLSDDETKKFDDSHEGLTNKIELIDKVLKSIKNEECQLYYEIINKLHSLKDICDDEIRLKARKKILLKEHQEHYIDSEPKGYGYRFFNITQNEIDSIKESLSFTVEEFNN